MIRGAAQMDGAFLVVSAADGTDAADAGAHFAGAEVGLRTSLVYMNKCDWWTMRRLEAGERRLRELLGTYDSEATLPIVKGAAKWRGGGQGGAGEQSIRSWAESADSTYRKPKGAR